MNTFTFHPVSLGRRRGEEDTLVSLSDVICGLVFPTLEMTKIGSYSYFPALAGTAASSEGKNYTGGRRRTLPIMTDGVDVYHNIKKGEKLKEKEKSYFF